MDDVGDMGDMGGRCDLRRAIPKGAIDERQTIRACARPRWLAAT